MIVVPEVSVAADRVAFGDRDALAVCAELVAQGARALHLRDGGGGIVTAPGQATWLQQVVHEVGVPVSFDGGIRDSQSIELLAALGFSTVVLSQHALSDPMLLRWAQDLLGDRLAVELQADADYLFDAARSGSPGGSRSGGSRSGGSQTELVEAIRALRFQGVRHVFIRDVTALELPLHRLSYICRDLDVGITYSGPVRSVDDLRELIAIECTNLRSVVVGDAVHDGRIRIEEANRAVEAEPSSGGR